MPGSFDRGEGVDGDPVAHGRERHRHFEIGPALTRYRVIDRSQIAGEQIAPRIDDVDPQAHAAYGGGVVRQAAAAGKREALPGLLADLVKQPLDIIVTSSASETLAAKRATSTVPIVMTAVFDPVTEGLVESLARPGGNVTGLTILVPGLSQKYVELLKEVVPATRRFTVVTGRAWAFPQIREELLSAARQVGVTLSFAEGNGPDELATVLARARKDDSGAIIAPLDGRTYLHRRALAQLALQHRLPGIYWSREYVEDGGLMAYGAALSDVGRRAATFVDKIFRGAKPADLPVERPTKFEFVINFKTAKALGLTIPPSLLLRADQVIE